MSTDSRRGTAGWDCVWWLLILLFLGWGIREVTRAWVTVEAIRAGAPVLKQKAEQRK